MGAIIFIGSRNSREGPPFGLLTLRLRALPFPETALARRLPDFFRSGRDFGEGLEAVSGQLAEPCEAGHFV